MLIETNATLKAVKELKPITIFHEPINIRAENVARIAAQAAALGIALKTEVFATREAWQDYALESLHNVHQLAKDLGIEDRLHLWPDASLANQSLLARVPKPKVFLRRLEYWWNRVSEWPTG